MGKGTLSRWEGPWGLRCCPEQGEAQNYLQGKAITREKSEGREAWSSADKGKGVAGQNKDPVDGYLVSTAKRGVHEGHQAEGHRELVRDWS